MSIKKGLGRNLDALLGAKVSPVSHAENDNKMRTSLPIDFLQPGKYQPRNAINNETLAELAQSIKTQGIIQPIIVRKINPQHYEILAGERRFRAAKLAGLQEVPVVIREVTDNAAMIIGLIENIQREDLNPIEEASALERLINEFSLTHQEVADAVGRSRTAVSNLLRLINLASEVKVLLSSGLIDMGHARALLSLDVSQQVEVANRIVSHHMTVRDVENYIQQLQSQKTGKINSQQPLSAAFLSLQKQLSDHFKNKVELKPGRGGSGRLVIHYKNRQELTEITSEWL